MYVPVAVDVGPAAGMTVEEVFKQVFGTIARTLHPTRP
jgi:hypothetical protein